MADTSTDTDSESNTESDADTAADTATDSDSPQASSRLNEIIKPIAEVRARSVWRRRLHYVALRCIELHSNCIAKLAGFRNKAKM